MRTYPDMPEVFYESVKPLCRSWKLNRFFNSGSSIIMVYMWTVNNRTINYTELRLKVDDHDLSDPAI